MTWACRLGMVAAGVVCLYSLVTSLPSVLDQLWWNADVAASSVIGKSLAPGDHVTTYQALYTWVAVLVPQHVQQLFPIMLWALTLGVLTRTSTVLGGRWSGLTTAVMGVAAAPFVVASEVAPSFHGAAWAAVALLGAWVGLRAYRTGGQGVRQRAADAAIAGTVGVVLGQDVTVFAAGVLPLASCAVLLRLARGGHSGEHRRAATRMVLLATSTTVVGAVVQVMMYVGHFSNGLPPPGLRGLADAHLWMVHRHVLVGTLLDMANGERASEVPLTPYRVALAATLVVLGLAAVVFVGVQWLFARRSEVRKGNSSGLALYAMFWLMSGAVVICLFIFTRAAVVSESAPIDALDRFTGVGRYLVPVFLSVVAVAPSAVVVYGKWLARSAMALAVALLCLTSTVNLRTATAAAVFRPAGTIALPQLMQALEARRLHRGYAGYWDAIPLTQQSTGQLTVRPARDYRYCAATPASIGLCADVTNVVQEWYTPQSGPTFVVVDQGLPGLEQPPGPALGRPLSVFSVARFTVYVYSYDVVARWVER